MNQCQTLRENLGTNFGNESSARVVNRISHAYKNGTRGAKLGVYLKEVVKDEGILYDIPPFLPPNVIRADGL